MKVVVRDITSKFVKFFETAYAEEADEDRRWQLWNELYGFAAVPPTPEGKELARTMLNAAWEQYPAVMERIRMGVSGMEPRPQSVLEQVADLFECTDDDFEVNLLAFVGLLDGNAFAYTDQGSYGLCLPVEDDPETRKLILPHESAHVVHFVTSGVSGAWERPISSIVMAEGLAMHTAAHFNSGLPASAYTEYTPGWLAACEAKREDIFRGIVPFLDEASSESVQRFTFGHGTCGFEREAYFVGWHVVDWMLKSGMSFAEIAHMKADSFSAVVEEVIEKILWSRNEKIQ